MDHGSIPVDLPQNYYPSLEEEEDCIDISDTS
jgi:hypothetical protein